MISEATWQQLLAFKQQFAFKQLEDFIIGYTEQKGFVHFSSEKIPQDALFLFSDRAKSGNGWQWEELVADTLWFSTKTGPLPPQLSLVKQYAVLIILPLLAKRQLPFVLVHMAQTIDGKICTTSGHSKWIGNQENLIHAHRLRALMDAVLVGGNTIATDLPKLSVRHVAGPNPIRLLLSNSFVDFENLPFEEGNRTILIRSNNQVCTKQHPISEILYYKGGQQTNAIPDILQQLKSKGIHSILVEGGAITVGSFLKTNLVDMLQFHIAPIVFGSGKSAISLPTIETVSEGIQLQKISYQQMGDAMMITGMVK